MPPTKEATKPTIAELAKQIDELEKAAVTVQQMQDSFDAVSADITDIKTKLENTREQVARLETGAVRRSEPKGAERLVSVSFVRDFPTATHTYREGKTYAVPASVANDAIKEGAAKQAKDKTEAS